ncbi:TPA: hypothetical protein ACMD15_003395 [Vibrio cholerae]
MINVKIKINFSGLHDAVDDFQDRFVRVGVLDDGLARNPDLRKRGREKPPTKALKEARGERALRVRSKNPNLKMKKLAQILDSEFGIFSKADLKFADQDLKAVIELLAETFGNPVTTNQKRRIENACIALVRNPIMNRRFGTNSPDWARKKGFNWPMVSTGSFLQSIEAELHV